MSDHLSDEKVSTEEFSKRIEMMVSLLTEPPRSYGQEARNIWEDIRDARPYNYNQQVIKKKFCDVTLY